MIPDTPQPSTSLDASSPDEGWLLEQWNVLVARRRIVGLMLLVCVAGSAVVSSLTRPVYQATTRLLIERDNPKVLTFKDVTEVDSGRDDYYQTQYKLLQSRLLARGVVESSRLLASPEFGPPLSEEEMARIHAAPPGGSPEMESAIDVLLSRLRIQPEKNSRLVNIVFESGNPQLAGQVANDVARLYIDQSLEFRYQTSSEAGRWLHNQIEEQRKKVEQAEISLQALREHEGIVNIEERRTLLEQRLRELGTVATALKSERLQKEALYRQMQGVKDIEELPEVMRSPVIQSLRIELAALGRREAQLSARFLPEHPEVQQIRQQVLDTRARLASEAQRVLQAAENDARAAAAKEASILSALEATKADALHLSARSVPYDSRKREVEAAKAVLDSLLARAKETDVTRELKASNIRIVDPAVVPRRPARPDLARDLFTGLFLGLGLGIGLAFFLDHLDNRVKTPDDVRRELHSPLLAVIPEAEANGSGTPPLVLDRPQGAFSEGYRMLRTSISYSWSERAPRAIVVTSALPNEGKTLSAINLALVLASDETRTALVDCDLRRSQIHERLGLSRIAGLSDVLVGKVRIEDALQRVGGSSLLVLTAGTPVPSPADLFTGSALARVLGDLRSRFDWVILDSPPVGAVSDAVILSPLSDGVVVVTASEMSPRAAVREALRQISTTGARVLGVLLNRLRLSRHSYHYYGYHDAYHRTSGASSQAASSQGQL